MGRISEAWPLTFPALYLARGIATPTDLSKDAFLEGIGDLPVGQITAKPVQHLPQNPAPSEKIFPFPRRANHLYKLAPSRPQEGRFAIVTYVGRRMRWTRQCRMTSDADPPSLKLRRDWYQDRRVAFVETGADGEVVWSWHPDADVKLVRQ